MNLLDLTILVVVISAAVRWAKYGFSRGALSLIGFWLGILGGALAAPIIIQLVDDPLTKLFVALGCLFIGGIVVGTVGQVAGARLYELLKRFRLRKLDALFGALAGVTVTLATFWLLAALISGTPFKSFNRLIQNSQIVQAVNNSLPPAPTVLSRLATLIGPYNFPQVFIGREPRPVAPLNPPTSGEIAAALAAAGKSTVRIESTGCGGQLFGSGFIVANNLIMTNAHVVAGVNNPQVVDLRGSRPAEVIYFDPDMDIAVLRTSELAGNVLELFDSSVRDGTNGAVLGYPGGGPLVADPATIIEEIVARGRNIYGGGVTNRPVYTLQATVEQGNSGGPVVLPDGRVVGVIFAESVTYDDVGYAITSTEALQHLRRAQSNNSPVSTGRCIAG